MTRSAMRMMTWAGVTLGVVLCAQQGVHGQQRPLPEFQVARIDGTAVSGRTISAQSKWLLVYVAPGSVPSERLVEALQQWQSPEMLRRTVVVVDGRSAQAAGWVRRSFGDPAQTGWSVYLDPQGQARQALAITGAPTLIGIKAAAEDATTAPTVAWTIAGVLNDPNTVESPVRTWTER